MQPLQSYLLSPKTGFCIEAPAEVLPQKYRIWTDALDKAEDLLTRKRLRGAIEGLPVLNDIDDLTTERDLLLAHLVLSLLTAGYVWCEGQSNASKMLPMSLAVPFRKVSSKLGIQPIVRYSSWTLANCVFSEQALADSNRPFKMEDVRLVKKVGSDKNWEGFIGTLGLVEIAFVPIIKAVFEIEQYLKDGKANKANILKTLTTMNCAIQKMTTTMELFNDNLNAVVFYRDMLPLLSGWDAHSPGLPNGLNYENDAGEVTNIKLAGSSATQSGTLAILDVLLGVAHAPGRSSEFILEQRNNMLPEHRRFIEDIEKHVKLAEYVKSSNDEDLIQALNKCRTSLAEFRSDHIKYVSKFITVAATKVESSFTALKNTSKGGMPLLPYLKEFRDESLPSTK